MNMNPRILLFISLLALCMASVAGAETQTAAATAVTNTSEKPSTLRIKQNILTMQRAAIKRKLTQVQRCVSNAENPQILRDSQGNTNQVPKIDSVNCNYRLKQLKRELARLERSASQLSAEASVAAAASERSSRQAALKEIIEALSGSSQ